MSTLPPEIAKRIGKKTGLTVSEERVARNLDTNSLARFIENENRKKKELPPLPTLQTQVSALAVARTPGRGISPDKSLQQA